MASNSLHLPDNCFSSILTETENQIICSLLDINCRSLSTTLMRLLLSDGPEYRDWKVSHIGIAALVKDFERGMVFIKIFDFIEKTTLWEYHLTQNIEYKSPQTLLLAFEVNNSLIGINFSVEDEAIHFTNTVMTEMSKNKPQKSESLLRLNRLSKKCLSKENINTPTNFRHSLKIFYNPLTGFQISKPNDLEETNKSNNYLFNESFESEDEIQVEEAFQFLNQRDSITSYDSNMDIVNQVVTDNPKMCVSVPVPKARTRRATLQNNSVAIQTDHVETLYSVLVNKFFEPISFLTPPTIVKAMSYLASRSDLDKI